MCILLSFSWLIYFDGHVIRFAIALSDVQQLLLLFCMIYDFLYAKILSGINTVFSK